MTLNDLRKSKWVTASWSKCPGDSNYTNPYLRSADIDLFLNYTFKEIARKANLPYDENLINFLKEENSAFYEYLSRYTYPVITSIPRSEYESLKELLKIPKIDDVNTVTCDKVQNIINEFESLTDIDKLKVLEYLKLKEVIIK